MEHAAAMQREDASAFEALLLEHRGIVLKVAASYARGPEERADLAQEIAAQLWRAWPRYDPAGDPHEAGEQVRRLLALINTFEPLDRALMLLYLEERSTREMAEVLGLGESNVTTRLSRLKQRIRERLDPNGA